MSRRIHLASRRGTRLTFAVLVVVGAALFALGAKIDIALVLPIVLVAGFFCWLHGRVDLPPIHSAAGALIFGETSWVVTATLLQKGFDALRPHAIDIVVPTLLLTSFLAGRFALAKSATLTLWLLLFWEAYALYRGFSFAVAQPTLVIFLKIAIRLFATLALTLIALGWEAPGVLSLFDRLSRRSRG